MAAGVGRHAVETVWIVGAPPEVNVRGATLGTGVVIGKGAESPCTMAVAAAALLMDMAVIMDGISIVLKAATGGKVMDAVAMDVVAPYVVDRRLVSDGLARGSLAANPQDPELRALVGCLPESRQFWRQNRL